jgi:hypothetical protein
MNLKEFLELIAGVGILIGWYLLVTAIVGDTSSGVGWFTYMFGLPIAALIEWLLMRRRND